MRSVFEVIDKRGKTIYLSHERWRHINHEHPELSGFLGEIKDTLLYPSSICQFDDTIWYFYKYLKHRFISEKYLLVIVKYLNGEGFIITAYLVGLIK